MLSIGRRNKPYVLGAFALLLVFALIFSVSNSSNAKTPNLTSVHKADYGVGDSVAPANSVGLTDKKSDPGLLSGAKIEQDIAAEKKKNGPQVVGTKKTERIQGSDASLKAKEQSIEKAEKQTEIDPFSTSEESKDTNLSGKEDQVKADIDSKKGKVGSNVMESKDTDLSGKEDRVKTDIDSTKKGKVGVKESKSSNSVSNHEYVIMIDAGSTGSRVHIYSFDTSVSPPLLINEEFKMLKPGLSSFDTDTKGAAASLDPLLKLALDTIPKEKQSCSPVAVKATAGLRLLGETKSKAILEEVRRHLEDNYPFAVVEDDGISIMDGSDEGVYAWITTNYLLNNIGTSKRQDTAAIFDLGGGSTQVVFEPTDGESLLEGEHKYEIEFGGRKFVLYQYSHLGYGLMQARNKVNAAVLTAELKNGSTKLRKIPSTLKSAVADVTIENPCVPPGVTADNVIVEMENGDRYSVNFVSPKKSNPESFAGQCKLLTDSILNKDLECESKSCSFNGIYQPSFEEQFGTNSDMYIFSYFYDRLQPIGMSETFTLSEINDIMQSVCSGSHMWDQYFSQPEHIKELEDEPLWCLDLNFMVSLLHTGYDIPLKRELKTAKTIGGNELGWCLGASLPLLDQSNWTCRVTKEY
ncbi:hypothetical protein CANINC_002821 [Pichia inconspicua]|uniref:guanosine-diphosphatase n=1 Tax=Pichia inconspicua TaxID=52247 RepID=A0A4T0X078_9ASCO|nr:hypothetical protein CANINC_002821 [[Candida] inconspicua]